MLLRKKITTLTTDKLDYSNEPTCKIKLLNILHVLRINIKKPLTKKVTTGHTVEHKSTETVAFTERERVIC